MKTVMSLALLAILGASIGACSNTLQGIGQDVESAGEAIQDTFN